jgi:hypothetical protein
MKPEKIEGLDSLPNPLDKYKRVSPEDEERWIKALKAYREELARDLPAYREKLRIRIAKTWELARRTVIG